MKIYTKQGDQGNTSLVDGTRVRKGELRLEAYGGLDELNCFLGTMMATLNDPSPHSVFDETLKFLKQVQNDLFNLGSQLACTDPDLSKKLPSIQKKYIEEIESEIDKMESDLPPLKNFILPGGSLAAAWIHICRSHCRKIERQCVRLNDKTAIEPLVISYLNRLSDYFFVLARWVNLQQNVSTVEWSPR